MTAVNSSTAQEMVVTTTTRSSEATYSVVTKIVPSSVSTSTTDEVSVERAHRKTAYRLANQSAGVQFFAQVPPALPAKTRKTNHNMLNREGCFGVDGEVKERVPSTDDLLINGHNSENGNPPPLPLKKKHSEYMKLNCA